MGKYFAAPASVRGGKRYYQNAYANAMAHLRAFGSPHFLLTFTLNSEAPEFTEIIGTDDSWVNREDAVARLFINKEKELMDDIENSQVLGPLAAQFGTVEHQKRFVLFIQFIVCLFL